MSYEDTSIPISTPSPNVATGNSQIQTSNQQSEILNGPVAILWDIENCRVPFDVQPEDVAINIRMALRAHPLINGVVTLFSAYGDFNIFPKKLRECCQKTGVKLVDVPNGRKDAADKAILIDMFLFALDNNPPSTILLISGDVDFAPALHVLGQRGYSIILVIPSNVWVSSAMTSAGCFVWDWPSMARGEGFRDSYVDTLNEEEAIVYKGIPSRSQSLPLGLNEADQNLTQDWWVQPGDIQGLKGQLVKLCEMSGGTLPLVRIPSDYIRSFGRPLYMAEYGVHKLVNLIQKMADTFVIMGKGQNKHIRLRYSRDKQVQVKKCLHRKGKGVVGDSIDIGICNNMGSFNDAAEEDLYDERFDGLKQEVLELLVCYGNIPVPLSVFELLYEQRYKKAVDFQSFGVDGMEELIEKVRDVVLLYDDEENENKFIQPVVS